MKIWIDITNSPHVLFFRPFIERLEKEGHDVIVTARDFSHVKELLENFKIIHTMIGMHYGKSIWKKAFGYFSRNLKLRKFISQKKVDVALCHQSPYAMSTAKKLNIKKRIYIFDNETAKWQNRLAFSSSTHVISPTYIPGSHIKYNGIKESIYLQDFLPNRDVLKLLNLLEKNFIVVRPEPFTAAYYKGEENNQIEFIRSLVNKLDLQLVVIPRNENQKLLYFNQFGSKIIIPDEVIDTLSLTYFSKFLIGGGGTMNREAVALGVPVISTYSNQLLSVDKYLISEGLMLHDSNPNISLIDKLNSSKIDNNIISHGNLAYEKIFKIITN
tara:strand:- start:27671 stop:28654 length:984 start_codon:yes stop_codon:yes gene_type:complete